MQYKRNDRELWSKPMWAVCNWGTVKEVFYYRREALSFAIEDAAANGFKNWREIYEIHKVNITLAEGK